MNEDKFKVLREFNKNKNLSQRGIAKACNLSLGKTNRLIKSLIEDKLLEFKDSSYILTDKALKLLDEYKVDNAIIMAAGFASRFVPLSYETPKGLLAVYGERMVERQIKQLLDASITDITIVVGYLQEKFEYLIDKYGVKLIYSPDYATKNNLSTLYHVRYLLKNTYVLSSNNYITENPYNTYEFRSWYSAVETDGYTAEWCVDTDRKGRIKKIKVGGCNKWCLRGPAFFSKDFSEKIVPIIEDMYNRPGSEDLYWEHVLKENLDKLEIYINKQPKNTVYEFRNLKELKEFDKTYEERSNEKILSKISSIFHIDKNEIKGIRPLDLGMTNNSFLFEIDNKKYIYRIPGEGTEKLINREAEYRNYREIIPLGITENIVFMDPETGVKIAEYESESRSANVNDDEELKKCMKVIKDLHNSNIKVPHSFNIEKNILFYENICRENKAIHFEDYSLVRVRMGELISILKKMDIPIKFSHIDPVCDNFLVLPNGEFKLIDWEYAGMCDPVIDIAMFALYSYFDHDQLEKIMGYYFEGEPSYEERLRIYIYMALGGFLWALWAAYKQTLGVTFGDYILKMYRYAKDYYKRTIDLIEEVDSIGV